MKKQLLMLIFASFACPVWGTNPFLKEHEAYIGWQPWTISIGGVVALGILASGHKNRLSQAAQLAQDRRKALPPTEEEKRRQEEEGQRKFAEEQARQQRENAERIRRQQEAAGGQNPNAGQGAPAQAHAPACPICFMENRPLIVMHQVERGDQHRACEDCIYGQFKSAQEVGSDPNIFPGYIHHYRTHFNCCLCRLNVDHNIQVRMRDRFNRENNPPVNNRPAPQAFFFGIPIRPAPHHFSLD